MKNDPRTHETTNPQTHEPTDPQTNKPTNPRTHNRGSMTIDFSEKIHKAIAIKAARLGVSKKKVIEDAVKASTIDRLLYNYLTNEVSPEIERRARDINLEYNRFDLVMEDITTKEYTDNDLRFDLGE